MVSDFSPPSSEPSSDMSSPTADVAPSETSRFTQVHLKSEGDRLTLVLPSDNAEAEGKIFG